MTELKIDEELKALIPPLRESEYTQLEQNILSEGIREPIITWNGIIIDGHNRYSVAKKHGLNFEVKEMQFDSKDAVIGWMIYNQFGRRNLSVYDSVCLALKLKPQIEADAKKRKLAGKSDLAQNFAQGSTRDKIAALAGVSRETVRKVEKINELATHIQSDDIIAGLRSGGLSISLALEGLQYRKEDLERRTEEIKIHQTSMLNHIKEAYKNLCTIINEYESKKISLEEITSKLGIDPYLLKYAIIQIASQNGVTLDTKEISAADHEKFIADIKKLAETNKVAGYVFELAQV